jgi:uncharacterized membrane protein YccC
MKKVRFLRQISKANRAVGTITALNDAPWRWTQGIHAGLAMGLPVAIFTFLGHQSLGLIASLGGFVSLYCADRNTKERIIALPFVALGLLIASGLGILSAFNEWLTIACLILVTGLSVIFTIGIQLGAPGPIMFILISAVSNHLAAPPTLGGAAIEGHMILIHIAIGSAIAYFVVIVLSLLIRPGSRDENAAPSPPLSIDVHFDKVAASMAIRIIICVAVASLISKPLEAHRSYWVVLAAVAILQGGNNNKRTTTVRAIERLLGTLLGVVVFEVIALIEPTGLWVVLIIMLLQFATQVVIARNYTLALIFITPLALVTTTIGHLSDSYVSVQGRVIDTISGSVIALTIFWAGEIILGFFPSREERVNDVA